MQAVGVTTNKQSLQEIDAAHALLALKGVPTEEQSEAGDESTTKEQDDNCGLNLFIKALILLQKTKPSTSAMSNAPEAPSNEPFSADNNQNESASPTRKSPKTPPNAQLAGVNNANESDLPTPKSDATHNSPPGQHTSDEDINSSDLRTPESSASLSSFNAPLTSDDDITNSGLPTPETSASQTSSIALHTSDEDVNDPELQATMSNTSQTPPNPLLFAENLTVACPHCKELFSLKNAEISPEKNVVVAKKEDVLQVKQENVPVASKPRTPPSVKKPEVPAAEHTPPSVQKPEEPTTEQQTVKRKRNSSFGNNYSDPPKKANKNNFTVNYVQVNHNKPLKNKNKVNMNSDMVPIGDGHALVPNRVLKYMDWRSYTNATRKLLTAVFSRSVLATHSLTGKPSPAFPNKPAKKQLNPSLVNDIVQTVVDNCHVPESVVRTSITTKCADESKMLRSRMKTTKQKSGNINQENISPSNKKSDDSDDSY